MCLTAHVPVEQQVQNLFSGGKRSVGAKEYSNVCIVFLFVRRYHVLHQFLQRAGFNGPTLARLIETEGRICLHAQPSLPFTGCLMELHLPQRDGVDGSLLHLLSNLLNWTLQRNTEYEGFYFCHAFFFLHIKHILSVNVYVKLNIQ